MVWERMCCPVDFSWESRSAMEEAAELASRLGSELALIHVRPRPSSSLGSAEFEQGTVELEHKLEKWCNEATQIARRTVSRALLTGAPAEGILRFAREYRCDAIALGARGHMAGDHTGLGSVAQAVVRDSPCTVIVTRRPRSLTSSR